MGPSKVELSTSCFFQFSATELVFLDSLGGLSIVDVNTLKQTQIVSNTTFVSIYNFSRIYIGFDCYSLV